MIVGGALVFVEVTALVFDVNGLLHPTFEPVLLSGFHYNSLDSLWNG